MIPLSDGIPARRFPFVNVALIVANLFGKNVEDAFGHLRYLAFYVAGGFVAMMTQAVVTLLLGTGAEAHVPNLGLSSRRCRPRT